MFIYPRGRVICHDGRVTSSVNIPLPARQLLANPTYPQPGPFRDVQHRGLNFSSSPSLLYPAKPTCSSPSLLYPAELTCSSSPSLLYPAKLTWNSMEGEYQAATNRMERATLGTFQSTPLGIVSIHPAPSSRTQGTTGNKKDTTWTDGHIASRRESSHHQPGA